MANEKLGGPLANIRASTSTPATTPGAGSWNFPNPAPWILIGVPLLIGASFGSTEVLAAAFAYLILVAVILAHGAGFYKNATGALGIFNVQRASSTSSTTSNSSSTTGG